MHAKIVAKWGKAYSYLRQLAYNVLKMILEHVPGGRRCLAASIRFLRKYSPVTKTSTNFIALIAVGAGYSVLLLDGFWESVAICLLWTMSLTAALVIAWKSVFPLMQSGAVTAFIFLSLIFLSYQGIAMPPWQPLLPLMMIMTVASMVHSRAYSRQAR